MKSFEGMSHVDLDDLVALIARKTMTGRSSVWPFTDYTEFLTNLLRMFYKTGARMQSAGHVAPRVEIAANRAEIELVESIGPSPFSGSLQSLLETVSSPNDIIYVANPNRVTGANYSLADLQRMAETVPGGAVLIDEYYYDFFGISGAPLLESFPNIVLLRSFAASFGIRSSDAGYVLANPRTVSAIRESIPDTGFSTTIRKTILMTLVNDEALNMRLREVHEESLRIANELTRLGAQCRLTATDFILLRVADPERVAAELARVKVSVDDLNNFPAMKNYLRYRIQSPLSNDKLLQAFRSMPPETFRMKSIDRRTMTMRLKAHGKSTPPPQQETQPTKEPETFTEDLIRRLSSQKRKGSLNRLADREKVKSEG